MAKSDKDKVVKRGVYLYLDGSEIKNDIKSVETEMKGLISAQKRMTVGSEEYVRTGEKIRSLRGIINEHNAQLKGVDATIKKNTLSVGKLADGFNRFFGLIGAGVAALTGFTLALRSLRDEKNKLEESQAGLKALTGLDDESITWLTGQAKKLSTSMTEEGLRVRQSANEILDAYMLIGSAKPELLGNKEALAAVTEEAMRLQAAAKDITLNEAVDALTLSLNQYSAGADKAAQFTNVLAAGSKEGSANIASQAKAIRVTGVAAASANTSIEQTVGLIQTLAYKGIKDEIAGTGLKRFFLTLQTGSDETNPKIVGLSAALENLKNKQMDATAIKKMFGEEGYNVASVLINETEQVKKFTEAVTGTNIAIEQAAINSNTAAARLAQAKNELKLAGIELADRLNPAITVSTNMVTNLVKYLPGLIDWFKEWGVTFALLLGPVLLYNGALKAMNMYHVIANGLQTASTTFTVLHTAAVANATGNLVLYNGALIAHNKLLNSNSIIVKICTAATYLFASAKALLAGNTAKAGIALKAFQALGMTNIFIAVATAILAAGVALYKLATRTSEAAKAVNQFITESTKERDELRKLTDAAGKAGDGTQRRKELIDEINTKYGQYLSNLLTEKSSLNDIKQAYNEINIAMERNIAKKVLDEKTEEISREMLNKKVNSMNKVRDRLSNEKLSASQIQEITRKIEEATQLNVEAGESVDAMSQTIYNNIKKIYFQNGYLTRDLKSDIKEYADVAVKEYGRVKKVKDELSAFVPNPGTGNELPEIEVVAKDLKKDGKVTGTGSDDKKEKELFLELESEYNKKRANLKQLYLNGDIKTQEEYSRKMEELELNLLEKKLKIVGVEPEEREKIEQLILDAKIKILEKTKEQEKKNTEEKDKKQEDDFKKSMALKDRQESEEVMNLTERRMKENMTEEDFNNQLKEIHLRYINEKLEMTDIFEDERIKLLKDKQAIELDDYEKAEKEKEEILKEQFNIMKDFAGDFGELFAEMIMDSEMSLGEFFKKALQMALEALEKIATIAIAERTVKNISSLGFAGIAKATAEIALVKAAVGAAKGLIGNFYDGGYTPSGRWDQPQGIVHSDEFISNRFAVANPYLRPVFDLIDYAQRSNSVANLTGADIAAVLPSSGRGSSHTIPTSSVAESTRESVNPAFMALLHECTQTMRKVQDRFDKPIVTETYATGKRGTMEAEKLVERMESNVSRKLLKQ